MASANAGQMDLMDILSLLRRQVRLLAYTLLIGLGLALVYLVWTTPLYRASALVMVNPVQQNLLEPNRTDGPSNINANALIESEVEIIRSDMVALGVIDRADLLADPEFGPRMGFWSKTTQRLGLGSDAAPDGGQLLQATLQRFADAVTVRRRGLTYLIEMSVASESPEKAVNLANTLAQTYIDLQVAAKVSAALAARDVLFGQLDAAQRALAASEDALASYLEDNIGRLAAESRSPVLADLRLSLEATNRERLSAQTRLAATDAALRSENWQALVAALESDAAQQLDLERQRLSTLLGQTEAGSEAATDLATGLAEIENRLARQTESLREALRNDLAALDASGNEIRADIQREALSGNISADMLSDLYRLRQEAAIAQRQYDNLLARVRDLEAEALVQVADSRIVSATLAPAAPSFPNVKLVLALTVLGSLALGGLLALFSEYLVGGVHSLMQLANVLPIRAVVAIPRVSFRQENGAVADTIVDRPMSQFAETFRRLRAGIDRSLPKTTKGAAVIMVTSSVPAEGKSVAALALARTYALAGKRTLLIDGDMRKPTQHEFLGVAPKSGLLEYLVAPDIHEHGAAFYDVDPKTELGVIMGQRQSVIPTDRPIQSTAFHDLIKTARTNFDVIVIDTPPILPVVDARYIAPLADCVLLCVRYASTGQTDLRQAWEQLGDTLSPGASAISALTLHEVSRHPRRMARHYEGYYSQEA